MGQYRYTVYSEKVDGGYNVANDIKPTAQQEFVSVRVASLPATG